jgi:hypothetical protein
MNTRTTVAVVAISLAAVGVAVGVQAAARPGQPTPVTSAASATAAVTSLVFNREEELLAHDLYTVFASAYPGARQFASIARSEQRHTDAVASLLTRYGVPDPGLDHVAGVYADAGLQRLYDEWKATGLTSLGAAYRVSVDLEKRDIADLDAAIAGTSPADVVQVLGQLRAGSEHHLAAFSAAAEGSSLGSGAGQGRAGAGGAGAAAGCEGTGRQRSAA